jgi:O-antigen ligase
MRIPKNLPDLALAVLAIASLPLALAGPPALRAAVVGALLLTGPGGAAALWFWRASPGRRSRLALGAAFYVALAISLSLGASLLVATGMVYAHLWNPSAGVWVLAGLTLVLLGLPRLPHITWQQFLYGQSADKYGHGAASPGHVTPKSWNNTARYWHSTSKVARHVAN